MTPGGCTESPHFGVRLQNVQIRCHDTKIRSVSWYQNQLWISPWLGAGISGGVSSQSTVDDTDQTNSGTMVTHNAKVADNAIKANKFRRTSTRTDLQDYVE